MFGPKRALRYLPVCLLLLLLPSVSVAQDVPASQSPAKGPEVQAGSATLPCVADTSIAAYPIGLTSLKVENSEQGTNAGKSNKLKIKKFENRPVLRFDFSQVPAGATIAEAAIEIQMAGDQPLNHVGVYSLHVDWNEGRGNTSDGEKEEASKDGACFIGPKGVQSRWLDYPTGDFNKASGGSGGNATCVVRAESLGEQRWRIAVNPYVVEAAMQDGQTLILCDETGIFNNKLSNAFLFSREVKGKEPVLNVKWQEGRDQKPPQFDGKIAARPGPMAGTIVLDLPHAGDDATEGDALGYRVVVNGRTLPVAMTPRPQRNLRGMLLRDLKPGASATIEVTAYDEAGNTARQSLKTTAQDAFKGQLAKAAPQPDVPLPAAQTNDAFTATLVDGLTLFEPTTGGLAPQQMRQYVKEGKIESQNVWPAVRGEFLAMQCLVRPTGKDGTLRNIRVRGTDLKGPGGAIPASNFTFFREHYVKMKSAWIADVLPEITQTQSVSIPSQAEIPNQKLLGIYVDLLVPKQTKPGTYTGLITIDSDAGSARCPLAVVVQDVTLPDDLTFVVEMNAYGHSDNLKVFHETYRLCHAHRLSYNVLGYNHTGSSSFTIPKVKIDGDSAKITDWSAWDTFYGPLLSGEIAKDLPRAGVPATHWYLPFHDGWPAALSDCVPELYKGRVAPKKSKDAFQEWCNKLAMNDPLVPAHFCDRWRTIGKAVAEQFAEHFRQKGWTRTQMQVFNNHKYYFAAGSVSLWTMDEPQYGRDFRALNWQYKFFNDALGHSGMNHVTRGDISRPELMGDRYDDALELLVVSSAVSRHPVMVENLLATVKKAKLWWYGGGRGADADPAMYIPLFLSRWELGCDGGMPEYTSLAGTNDWSKADPLRVVRYDPKSGMPVASLRMKAYRQAQQDMELLNLLASREGFNRWHLRDLLETQYPIRMVTISSGPDDPGYSTFEDLNIARYEDLRQRVVATLLADKKVE